MSRASSIRYEAWDATEISRSRFLLEATANIGVDTVETFVSLEGLLHETADADDKVLRSECYALEACDTPERADGYGAVAIVIRMTEGVENYGVHVDGGNVNPVVSRPGEVRMSRDQLLPTWPSLREHLEGSRA